MDRAAEGNLRQNAYYKMSKNLHSRLSRVMPKSTFIAQQLSALKLRKRVCGEGQGPSLKSDWLNEPGSNR